MAFCLKEVLPLLQIIDIRLSRLQSEEIKKLSGFAKHHFVPQIWAESTERFVVQIAQEELWQKGKNVVDILRREFNYKRAELSYEKEGGWFSVTTSDLRIEGGIRQSRQSPSRYIDHLEMNSLKDFNLILQDNFNKAFARWFDELSIYLAAPLDLERLIDHVESSWEGAGGTGLQCDYHPELSSCELILPEFSETLRLWPQEIRISSPLPRTPKYLLYPIRKLNEKLQQPVFSLDWSG